MRLNFYGAARTVTGACFHVEVSGTRLLIDCGLFQGPREIRERNFQPFPFSPASLDYVLLTHAHIDHCGLIPRLCREGFKGKILATGATVDLAGVLLPDAAHIQEMEAERKSRKAQRAGKPPVEPLYTVADAYDALRFFQKIAYDTEIPLSPGVSATFLDAGHILGAAMILLRSGEAGMPMSVLFTGDLGRPGQRLVKDPAVVEHADYLVIESTYGNRQHPQVEEIAVLHDVLWRTYRRGGNVIIPAFAVERTQDLLYDLNKLWQAGKMPPVTVYIDSPLAVAVTDIFNRHGECYDSEARSLLKCGENPLNSGFVKFSVNPEESRALNEIKSGLVIIAGSGMCEAGRVRHHLKHNLWRPECTVVFVGYQAQGTLGRRILDGDKSVKIFDEEVAVRAEIVELMGYSAHADQPALLNWLKKMNQAPRQVFVVHGEPEAAETLRLMIEEKLGFNAVVPDYSSSWLLTVDPDKAALYEAYRRLGERLRVILQAGDPAAIAAVTRQIEAVAADGGAGAAAG
ncbi:metallo-beta-lactamase family protein [Thermodesulfitimonas autotrophica]|uniref:Metallo-beta-lactamase family protein n=1 Tax=Thermodesulfitimonas autotrophica TaxID=1894989 RepID=A0A3N5AE97_9THEO|nr:MBL fold metallo-hydrolase [Thermodesulfitimonas autotrophica]RPF42977.1 metallo-beta-lactamase family protein [Thermodesulfitimonas autotrophica]